MHSYRVRWRRTSAFGRRRLRAPLAGVVALASLAVATASAGAAPAVHPTAAGNPAPCSWPRLQAHLQAAPGFEATADREAVVTVTLTNPGRAACTLDGWPRLALVSSTGASRTAAQVNATNGAFGLVEPTQVTLQSQGSAAFFLAVPLGGSCPDPFRLRAAASTIDLATAGLRICSAGERIEVSAVHPDWLHLFQDYPAQAGDLDPGALQRQGLAACRAPQLRELRSDVEPDGSNGSQQVEVFIRNAGVACSVVSRWPVVSLAGRGKVLVDAIRDEALLPADVEALGGAQSPGRYVDLATGATAMFDILVRDPSAPPGCTRATTIEVRFGVGPGEAWRQVPAAIYRTATGIPGCGGDETLAVEPNVSVTPITAVPDEAHPLAGPALPPASDASGFGWAGDSSGGVCAGGTYPYGVEGLAKYGITGKCAGYFGQVGAVWSLWPGCPDSGWGWNPTDAAEAAANYPKYGVGNAFIYFTGGPGMKPPSVTTMASWADMQMENFAAQSRLSQYAKYVDEPVVILDVETGYGWNDTVTDPTTGTVGCAFPIVTSGTYSAAHNKALLADMVAEAGVVFPGYQVVVYTGGRYDWGPWFGSEVWKGGEYTFVNAIAGTPNGATGNLPGRFCLVGAKSPCAQYWGGQSPSSATALLWQWGSPVAPSTATLDIDQVDESRFPTHP